MIGFDTLFIAALLSVLLAAAQGTTLWAMIRSVMRKQMRPALFWGVLHYVGTFGGAAAVFAWIWREHDAFTIGVSLIVYTVSIAGAALTYAGLRRDQTPVNA